MGEIADRANSGAPAGENPAAMERRIFRNMIITVVVGVVVSLVVAPWQVTTGLLFGGILSLFSHHWLRTSVAAAFDGAGEGKRPRLRAARYVLRYLIVAASIAIVYKMGLISLVATLFGLCSFVVAALVEAFMQILKAIVNREEN